MVNTKNTRNQYDKMLIQIADFNYKIGAKYFKYRLQSSNQIVFNIFVYNMPKTKSLEENDNAKAS